ncbi:integrase core domain-containing protein [Chloroflexota bacterium]
MTTENGPEFIGEALVEWACRTSVEPHFTGRGKPMENTYSETIIGKLCDEYLSDTWILNITDTQETVEALSEDYSVVGW